MLPMRKYRKRIHHTEADKEILFPLTWLVLAEIQAGKFVE